MRCALHMCPSSAPPCPFVLAHDPADIDDRRSYSVRAAVTLGDRPLMTTDTHASPITRGAPTEVEMILRRVPAQPGGSGQVHTAPGLTLTASFTGATPMASGPGMAWHLDRWPDQVFQLGQRSGETGSTGSIGRWHADPGRSAIVLRGSREAPVFLEILADGDLRLMDLTGDPIDSALPYTLAAGPIQPAEVSLLFMGMVHRGGRSRCSPPAPLAAPIPARRRAIIPQPRALAGLDKYGSRTGGAPEIPVLAILEGRPALRLDTQGRVSTHLVIDRFEPRPAIPSRRDALDRRAAAET